MFGYIHPDAAIDLARLTASVKVHEGTGPMKHNRFLAYKDSQGITTVGYGRNIETYGLSNDEADALLGNDIETAIFECIGQPWWPHVSGFEPRARACCELMFILGPTKFAGFHNAIAGLLADDFETAANELLASDLAKQDGYRITVLAEMIRTGADPKS